MAIGHCHVQLGSGGAVSPPSGSMTEPSEALKVLYVSLLEL